MVTSWPKVPTRASRPGAAARRAASARRAQQRQVAFHAARDVEHDDEPDRLRRVVEERDRLRLALVADLEIVLFEIGDQASVVVRDRDEHADRVAGAAEGRLLRQRLLRVESDDRERGDDARAERQAPD